MQSVPDEGQKAIRFMEVLAGPDDILPVGPGTRCWACLQVMHLLPFDAPPQELLIAMIYRWAVLLLSCAPFF